MSLRRICLLSLIPALLVLGSHLVLQGLADWFVLDGRLIGPDAYMRVLRVMELAQNGFSGIWGGWYDPVSERSNAPFGEVLHWTRPLDLLLLLGGVVGAPFVGFDGALFAWAVVISPILHVVTIAVLLWACEPLFKQNGPAALALLGLLFAVQFFITFQFAVGRPDHHGLNALLFIWQMGFAFRLTQVDCPGKLSFFAALPAAIGLWVSIEGALGIGLILSALAMSWIHQGGIYLRRLQQFLIALCLFLTLALILERPVDDLTTVAFDRLSVVHLAVFVLLIACVFIAQAFTQFFAHEGPALRMALAVAGGAVTATTIGLWLPDFLKGPMAAMDPLVYEVWFRHNAEVSPALNFDALARTLPKAMAHLGLVFIAIPALAHQTLRSEKAYRRHWLILAIFLGLTLIMALGEARWMGYAQILSLPPCIALLQALFTRFSKPGMGPGMGPAIIRISAVIILATGPLIGAALMRKALPTYTQASQQGPGCEATKIALYLRETYSDRPYRMFNFIYAGPSLMFHSHHEVVATPYHRNTAGIVDNIKFFRAIDPAPALSLIKQRGIDLILICPDDPEASNYRQIGGPPTLLMRLEQGPAPAWLLPVQLPADLAENYKLFQVRP